MPDLKEVMDQYHRELVKQIDLGAGDRTIEIPVIVLATILGRLDILEGDVRHLEREL